MKLEAMKRVIAAGVVAAWFVGMNNPVSAQVASSIIHEGTALPGLPGETITSTGIGSPAVNHVGGWALLVTTSGTGTLSSIWGTADGVTAPDVFITEATYTPLVQTSFEAFYGLSDAGSVCYSATGTGGPDGAFDSVWVDTAVIAMEGDPLPAGPLQDLFWSFASRPSITGNGIPHFVGGTRTTPGGSSSARGLFGGMAPAASLYSGWIVAGLPAPLDDSGTPISFDYRISPYGGEFIAEIEMETTGYGVTTSNDNAMVLSGAALFAGGSIVREQQPIPAGIGGQAGELWDNFDYTGVSDFGEFFFTGDTASGAGGTSQDEIVVLNGMIVAREGFPLDGHDVSGSIEGGYMNQNGDWAVTWDINDPGIGNIEALFFNGQLMLREQLDDVDFDGDGFVDAGARISATTGFSGLSTLAISDRDAAGDVSIYFTAEVEDNGAPKVEGLYRMVVSTTPGPDGDLELRVVDSPDPLADIPGDITYSVRVRNNSPNSATGVTVVSTLDATLAFNGGDAIAVHDGSPLGGTVTATIGGMAPYEVYVYEFAATADSGPIVTTTSALSGNEVDTVPGNNSSSNDTTVALITDLAITLADAPDPVTDPGGAITYTVEVTNNGPSAATGVSVTMNLDGTTAFNAGLSDAIAIHDGSPLGGVVTAAIGSLANGASSTFDVVVNVTAQGILLADVAVTGNEVDVEQDDNTAIEDTLFELSADLWMTMSDAPDPVIPAGGQLTYAVEVGNDGPSTASGVLATIILDPNTSFVSADPPAVHAAGVVTANFGAMGSGSSATFNILVDTTVAGRIVAAGDISGSGNEADPDPGNNVAMANTLVLDVLTNVPIGIFSNILTSPTSDVPDLPGVKFGTGCDRPYRSPDGTAWIISCDTDLASATDEVIIIKTADSAPKVAVQEGVTVLDLGDLVGLIDTNLSVNDANEYAFATNTNNATSADEVIVKHGGGGFVTVAREGDPAADGNNYGSILRSPNITDAGTVWFDGDTTGSTSSDQIIFADDGARIVTIVLQEGVTIPTGQDGGATFAWDLFDSNDVYVDATGTHYVVQGDTEDATTADDIFAYDNNVVVQENVILPGSGFTEGVDGGSSVVQGSVMSNGDWFARGDNNDNQDWVLKNGAVLAATGDPIHGGSPELFDDGPFAACFFQHAGNNNGDYVIAGTTNSGDDMNNAVLVLNGSEVIARENDLVDLDGNGIFDDGVRIRTFGNDDIILTDVLGVYLTVTLRDADNGSNTDVGDAFLAINLPFCGNGIVDPDEDCDDPDSDCCTASCEFVAPGAVCGDQSDTDCTDPDSCDGAGACQDNHANAGDACGDPSDTDCTDPDSCDGAGACQDNHANAGDACGDPSDTDCTDPDSCDGGGACQDNHANAGDACGDPSDTDCTDPDSCDDGGNCLANDETGGTKTSPGGQCEDDNECTNDECDGSGGCQNPNQLAGFACGDASDTDCTDPDSCDGGGTCLANDELGGTETPSGGQCEDDNECTNDECDGSGGCQNPNQLAGFACGSDSDTDCDDPDTCDGEGGCLDNNEEDGTACTDDGDSCTDDFCTTAECNHPPFTLPDPRTCGACCYATAGKCYDDQLEDECRGDVWAPNENCAARDITCEKTIIPTISEWGLLVVSLLLLIGIAAKFGRQRAESA